MNEKDIGTWRGSKPTSYREQLEKIGSNHRRDKYHGTVVCSTPEYKTILDKNGIIGGLMKQDGFRTTKMKKKADFGKKVNELKNCEKHFDELNRNSTRAAYRKNGRLTKYECKDSFKEKEMELRYEPVRRSISPCRQRAV